jgi:hypothetical protein
MKRSRRCYPYIATAYKISLMKEIWGKQMRHINKKKILGVLLIALLIAALSVGAETSCGPGPGPSEISKDQAIAILVSEIIRPAADYKGISAFMLSEPLQEDDVITSESDEDYPIDTSTWFVFIDDEPMAFFAHDCRYVFINGETGSYEVINESWPPEINGFSMFDTQNVGRGHIIDLWSVLDSAVPIAGSPSQAPTGDYGDAPDGQLDLYYGITCTFPTLYNTTNSHFGRPGGHTLNVGEETLGLNVSAEVDANDPADPDGVPNLVDADSDERIFVIVEGTQAKLAFTVTIAPNVPDVTRYANALIDFDQSGNWSAGTYGTEWVVVNMEVDVDPGSSETVITPWFSWGNKAVLPSPVWVRLLLAREEVDEALFANVGGWDGSGPFEYGEVEDYFAFLTDMPPPPDGDDDVDGPQPPGPEKGTCGYDINYYVLIINCGDQAKHMRQGIPIVQVASSSVASAAQSQGYKSMGNMGPSGAGDSQTSLANIGNAIEKLAKQAKCGDHVLVYICGHGGEWPPPPKKKTEGGIRIYNSLGSKTGEVLTPSALAAMLGDFDACNGQECGTPGCCHVSVVIESCYAGKFNIPGLNDQENIVVSGSSNDTKASGIYPGGGVYTAGFVSGLQDSDADTDDPPNGVDPAEAHGSADAAVQDHPWSKNLNQQSWIKGNWCDCVCPSCSPGIDVEKWVLYWDGEVGIWMDEIQALPEELVTFRLDIESTGTCRYIVDLEIIDFLPGGLEYLRESVTITYDEEQWPREPDEIVYMDGETGTIVWKIVWNLKEIEALAPGETIAIVYKATAVELGSSINEVWASAHCAVDPSKVVSDEDEATVTVVPPEQQDVLEVGWNATCNCGFTIYDSQYECDGCVLSIYFWAEDISGGSYPVTNVALMADGHDPALGPALWYSSGSISTEFFEHTYVMEGPWCGETYEIIVEARNSNGTVAIAASSFTCPSKPEAG